MLLHYFTELRVNLSALNTNTGTDFQTEKSSNPSHLGIFIGQQAQFYLLVQ